MVKQLLNLEREISDGQVNAKKVEEIYHLLSTYNAYNILLLKVKIEHEKLKLKTDSYYSHSDCYKDNINDLFSLFKSDECLRLKQLSRINTKDMIFLIDKDTLLRINSFDIMSSDVGCLSRIGYELLEINNCIAKIYKESVYCGDPYYCDSHWEKKDAFGLFYKDDLITPSYILDSQFGIYDNMNIREILKVQPLEDIQNTISQAKNEKIAKVLKMTNN